MPRVMCHLPLVSRNQQPTNCELFAAAISICMTALQVVFYATAGAAGGTGNLKLDQAMSLEPAPIFVSYGRGYSAAQTAKVLPSN